MSVALARRDAGLVIAGIVIVAIAAVILHLIGHPWFCKCGYVRLWWGETVSAENSQQITDWYTPTHIVHGLIFYFLLWLVARRLPLGLRAFIALLAEAGWEVLENTPLIIDRYREQTVSLGYFGDSVINSMSDIVAMLVGFYLASRLPVWASVVLALAIEIVLALVIRDNLLLNVLMLIYPVPAVLEWQAGG